MSERDADLELRATKNGSKQHLGETAPFLPADPFPAPKPPARVAVIIPAHNEEEGIAQTVLSLLASDVKPDRIIVMSDNSTDGTVAVARAAGAEVHETVDNTVRKAGAINQALSLVIPTLEDHDIVMTMDADGTMRHDAIQVALDLLSERPEVGAMSGSVTSRGQSNYLEVMQAIEYERGRRLMARGGGKIHVLSGAAAFFRVSVLKHVADERGRRLPGKRGQYMLENSLVEDYELTLAIKELGYKVTSTKRCVLITDLMPNLSMLEAQRMRWIRGTMEETYRYGWKPYTRKTWVSLAWNLFVSFMAYMTILALVLGYVAFDSFPNAWFLLLIVVFMSESVIVARRLRDKRAMSMALAFVPLYVYDLIVFTWTWRSLWFAVTKRSQTW